MAAAHPRPLTLLTLMVAGACAGDTGEQGATGATGATGEAGPLPTGVERELDATLAISNPANGTHFVVGEAPVVTVLWPTS